MLGKTCLVTLCYQIASSFCNGFAKYGGKELPYELRFVFFKYGCFTNA